LVPNSNPEAGIFRLEGGRKVQRSASGIRSSWESYEVAEKANLEAIAAREARELEDQIKLEAISAPLQEAFGDAIKVFYNYDRTKALVEISVENFHRLVNPFRK